MHIPTFKEAKRAASASFGGVDQNSPQRSPQRLPSSPENPRTSPLRIGSTGGDDAGERRLRFSASLSVSGGVQAEEGPDQGMPFLRPGEHAGHTGHVVVAPRARIPALSHLSCHALTDPIAPWLEVLMVVGLGQAPGSRSVPQ